IHLSGGTAMTGQFEDSGDVTITGGATLTSGRGFLSPDPGTDATFTLSGAGSTWTNTAVNVGGHSFAPGGKGTVTVNPGALINDLGPLIVWGSSGTALNINGGAMNVSGTSTLKAGGQINISAGALNANTLFNNATIGLSGGGSLLTSTMQIGPGTSAGSVLLG